MRLIDADLLLDEKNKKMVGEYSYNLMHCLVSDMPSVNAIPIEKLEQIRAELLKEYNHYEYQEDSDTSFGLYIALSIIDKAIKEQTT